MKTYKASLPLLFFLTNSMLTSDAQSSISIATCEDLLAAGIAASTRDAVATLDPGILTCEGYQTLRIENNKLTIHASAIRITVRNLRIEVAMSGHLEWDVGVTTFSGDEESTLALHGGWLNVEAGSTAHFLGDIVVNDYNLLSEVTTGDFTDDLWDGGCVWNQGAFAVDGHATFRRCDITGGGESNPGRGGAVFNEKGGIIVLTGGTTVEDITLSDDEGNDGAGIYNLGDITIEDDSRFQDLDADPLERAGGAIYNAEGATVTFTDGTIATFDDCRAYRGGGIFNAGTFTFAGPALFYDCASGKAAVYNTATGSLTLATGSSFWENEAGWDAGAILNEAGGVLDIADGVSFEGNSVALEGCDNVRLEEPDGGFTCPYD